MNIDTSKLDFETASKINEILTKYNSDLEEHNIDYDTELQDVLKSHCSLTTKSIFALEKLIEKLPNGEIRPQQVEMLSHLSEVIEDKQDGLLQAGTGVGKSIAYLIPAIISGRKIIVSTSTKQLTAQLTEKDLPILKKYLFPDLKFTGLQSLSNYICFRRYNDILEELEKDEVIFEKSRPDDLKALKEIKPLLEEYNAGNLSLEDFTLDTLKNNCDNFLCAGSSCVRACKFEGKELCPVYRIVKKVLASDVVVTNHAYISNMLVLASKDTEKKLGILKGRNLWICDEAHDLEGYLERAFSANLNLGILKHIYLPKLTRYTESNIIDKSFNQNYKKYETSLQQNYPNIAADERYYNAEEIHNDVVVIGQIVGGLINMLEKYKFEAEDLLEYQNQDLSYKRESLEEEFEFKEDDIADIKQYILMLEIIKTKFETLAGVEIKNIPTTTNILNEILDVIKKFYAAYLDNNSYVSYYNYMCSEGKEEPQFTMSVTYLKSGDALQSSLGYLDLDKSDLLLVNSYKINMVGVSATLCIDGGFRDIGDKLGMLKLKDIHCYCTDVGTVFDYRKQGLMYVPKGIPDVKRNRNEHFDFFKAQVKQLIEASKGGALILCTTKKETSDTYKYLSYEFDGIYNILSAEDTKWKNKNELVKAFREDTNSVLVGTRGFFQGLDVQGESLRLLCLNKLPFETPGVVSNRKSEIAKAKGLDPFRTTAVVPTTMMLLQAIGRLIRHTSDRGVVAIFDDRLYKGVRWMAPVLRSLPPFDRADEIKDVEDFYNE